LDREVLPVTPKVPVMSASPEALTFVREVWPVTSKVPDALTLVKEVLPVTFNVPVM
jgi:hypothetical protein